MLVILLFDDINCITILYLSFEFVNFCNDYTKNPKVFEKYADNKNIKYQLEQIRSQKWTFQHQQDY